MEDSVNIFSDLRKPALCSSCYQRDEGFLPGGKASASFDLI